ncbi:MAG: ATP-binding protein [Sphingomonas sp.]|jgi:signal transduction histidine kinase|uniref:ATP-binding protein n=1 Tax=Sphingomonas sp. TaxID=28214 RepID=UPI00356A4B98
MTIASNLSLRITAILLAGFVALQLLIVAATTLPSRGDDRRPYNLPLPAQARAMVDALDRAPAGQRPSLLDAFNGGLYTVSLAPGLPAAAATPTPDLELLSLYYARALPGRDIAVDGRRPRLGRLIGSRPRPARFFAPVTVAIGLRNGGAVVLTSQPSPSMRRYFRSRSWLGALGGLIVLAALALAVRQTTRPLVRLSREVRRFGASLDAPDLPVAGPREVRELSSAFNEMKGRIRDLMAERTRVLAAIAHDMRTYLTRLRLRAEFIDDPRHRDGAVRDLDEMAALLDDTLFLAEGEADRTPTVEVDLAAAAEALVAVRRELGDAVTLDAAGPLPVRATPQSVRRILGNLIDNGLRYGTVVRVHLVSAEDRADLIVEDDGPGVPPEVLARLGEPFNRLDASRNRETGGAGLGLAIVRALAGRDGAEVIFANRTDGGLRVIIRYPAA